VSSFGPPANQRFASNNKRQAINAQQWEQALRNQMSSERSQVDTGRRDDEKNGNSAKTTLANLLTENQVSMIFNVSVNTLRYWRHCGDGPNYVKMGRLVRYHTAALESYLQRKTCVSKARATAEEHRVAH